MDEDEEFSGNIESKKPKNEDLLIEAKNFFDAHKRELGDSLRDSEGVIFIDFMNLTEFSNVLSDEILANPEETLRIVEQAIEQSGLVSDVRVRLYNLSKGQDVKIRNIRSKHLNEMIVIEGIIRQSSDVRPQVVNAKFECPSCLPKGTLVQTPCGLQKIEDVDKVLSVNKNFNLIEKKANVIKTGVKKVFKINNDIECSKEHKWFVYRNGKTLVIQTKDLKIGDIFYQLHEKKLCNLWKRSFSKVFVGQEKNVQLGLQEEIGKSSSDYGGASKIRQQKNNRVIQRRQINSQNCKDDEYISQIDKEKIDETWNKNEDNERTVYDKCERFKYLQAWKEMWGKRIFEIGERELSNDLCGVRENKRQQKRVVNSPQRWKSSQQQIRQLNDSLQFVPFEVTQINETKKEVEMYDLQVPDTNNFILSNGIITHNCGTVISVLQMEKKFREPSRCSCGRRGGFKLISKEMVDTQRLVIEESPESLSGGEQPKRINVFVKEDLVEPRMEEKTTPGARIKIIGVLKEVPVPLPTGGLSTRFELAVEANNVIPLEETFEELDINEEDERQILELSEDPEIFGKLSKSICPSIWGYDEIKQSLVLQLFGGVQKK